MNKTKVDDMLIEMITPQVKEIEEKFSRGDGLTQTDIHTLLLKSQYNHINHLDEKLDEVTNSVKDLEYKFEFHKNEINAKFDVFKAEVREDIANLKTDVEKTIKETMKWYIGGVGVVIVALKLLDVFIK